jgi:hypothetical protein
MRSIINISLPKETAVIAKRRAKMAGFVSMSEYVRALLEMDDGLISADELLKMSERAHKAYRSKKLVHAHSLADLLR